MHATNHQLGCCTRQARIGDGAAARRLAAELVAGINHVQYNQGNDINALAGMVRRAGRVARAAKLAVVLASRQAQ